MLGYEFLDDFQGRVAVPLDHSSVSLRDFTEVWCVNDQFTALFDNRTKPVTRFAANPQVIVMIVKQRDHTTVLSPCVLDMNLPADRSALPQRFTEIACK